MIVYVWEILINFIKSANELNNKLN